MTQRRRWAALSACGVLVVALLSWLALMKPAPAAAPLKSARVPVVVGDVQTRDMPIWLAAVGTVQALNVVAVRARIEGELQSLHFTEGAEVHAGDTLARIDPRPFEAQLRQAEANLRKDEAQLAHARAEVDRYNGLVAQGFVAPTTVEALKTTADALTASVQSDRAQVDTARLQLGYTTIKAPIAGRVGLRQADPGSLVRASDANALVTLSQTQPIAVLMSVPQDELPALLAERSRGKVPAVAEARDGSGKPLASGELTVTDNQIDPGSGQIRLKAVFANRDGALWPGQLVSARLLLRTDRQALVVPARAALAGQDGPYVYVLQADQTVQPRKVQRGSTVGDLLIVRSGLAAGETVVVEGQSRLAPGVKVEARKVEAPKGPTPAASGAGA